MSQIKVHQGWYIGFLVAWGLIGAIATPQATAQITPDSTLGNEGSRVIRNVTIRGGNADRIDGGATRGSNLFHSFLNFNVNEGQRVYFANPAGVQNILTRVTGNTASDIMGTLGVDGGANLFVLNPNGIIFGPNAQLDVSGSFTASTANSFTFPGGSEFSAANPGDSSLLSVAVPLGVQYGVGQRGDITNTGNLAVNPGQALTLYGGTVRSSGSLTAPGGTVQVLGDRVALIDNAQIDVSGETGGGTVLVGGDYRGQGSAPNASRTFVGSDVILNADAGMNGNGGRVIVWADEATGFYGTISARGGNLRGNGGFVEVSGLQNLAFDGQVDVGANTGQAGQLLLDPTNVTIAAIAANNTELNDNQILFGDATSGTFFVSANAVRDALQRTGATSGGTVIIQATDTINITSGFAANSASTLRLEASNIRVSGAQLRQSGGGSFILDTSQNPTEGSVTLQDSALISTRIPSGETLPSAGNIQITTSNFEMASGAQLSASTFGEGNAGLIQINATRQANLSGSPTAIFNNVENGLTAGAIGDAGGIVIDTPSLVLRDGAQIQALVRGVSQQEPIPGKGQGGTITINADSVSLDGFPARVSTSLGREASGNAGNIFITTDSLNLSGGAQLSASTFGEGNAGFIQINARNRVALSGDRTIISNNVENRGVGDARGIVIDSPSIRLSDGAQIQSLVRGDNEGPAGQGQGGTISIINADTVSLNGTSSDGRLPSRISAELGRGADGAGGNILITTNSFNISDGATLSTSSSGQTNLRNITQQGNAGNITITANTVGIGVDINEIVPTTSRASSIQATTNGSGRGGIISIHANGLVRLTERSFIRGGTGGTGDAGSINIRAGNLLMESEAGIIGDSDGGGNGASISLNVADEIRLVGGTEIAPTGESTRITLGLLTRGTGSVGSLTLNARSLFISDGAIIKNSLQVLDDDLRLEPASNGSNLGTRGRVEITARNINISGSVPAPTSGLPSGIFTSTQRSTNAGDILIRTENFRISDGAIIGAGTENSGRGGTITIRGIDDRFVNRFEALSGGQLATTTNTTAQVGNTATGRAGNIEVYARQITLSGRDNDYFSRINRPSYANPATFVANAIRDTGPASGFYTSASNSSLGNAGDVILNTPRLTLRNRAIVSAQTLGNGRGGAILLSPGNGRSLIVNLGRNSQISASTSSSGRGGNMQITAPGSVGLRGGGQMTVETTGTAQAGQAGNLRIETRQLAVNDGTQVSVAATGTGAAGNLIIDARQVSVGNNARVSASNRSFRFDDNDSNRFRYGNVRLRGLDTLVVNSGEITASTRTGRAGNVEVNANDSVEISGNGRLAVGATRGRGRAGNLTVTTDDLTIRDGAEATVSSRGEAGNLTVNADSIELDNGSLTAIARSGNEGNININMSGTLFQIYNRSTVTAGAENQGNGGSVNIRAENGFVLANPYGNSDILANANAGRGGDIDITTNVIFGLEERDPTTDLSDINAASQFNSSGSITLNTLNVDPTRGLGELPVDIVDTAGLVADGCVGRNRSGVTDQGEFTQTGRGGLSANPGDPLTNEATSDRLATLEPNATPSSSASIPDAPIVESLIVEAQGLGLNSQGKVSLVSNSFVSTPSPAVEQPTTCITP